MGRRCRTNQTLYRAQQNDAHSWALLNRNQSFRPSQRRHAGLPVATAHLPAPLGGRGQGRAGTERGQWPVPPAQAGASPGWRGVGVGSPPAAPGPLVSGLENHGLFKLQSNGPDLATDLGLLTVPMSWFSFSQLKIIVMCKGTWYMDRLPWVHVSDLILSVAKYYSHLIDEETEAPRG